MGNCFYNFSASFYQEACCTERLTLKERKLTAHSAEDNLLGVSDGGCVFVVFNFRLPRLGSLVVCLQSAAIQTRFQRNVFLLPKNIFFRV